jgi:hypothetical protein
MNRRLTGLNKSTTILIETSVVSGIFLRNRCRGLMRRALIMQIISLLQKKAIL